MKNYYRVILGRKNRYADEAHNGNFIGVRFISDLDLINHLSNNLPDFNQKFIPIFLEQNPGKTKVAAGLACGMLWRFTQGIQLGDIVLCPTGKGNYYVGEVSGDYKFHKDQDLPHRRAIDWFSNTISHNDMSQSLRNSLGAISTLINISKYTNELESLLSGNNPKTITTTDETIEDPSVFALEKHLEDFLVHKWQSTDLGKNYDIYEEEGEMIGQQYQTDTGFIDILAISKDKKTLLVVELKKGRVSDIVVGQCLRYMGYVKAELAEDHQNVRGVIIGFEDDVKIKHALYVAQNIDFYTYKINFQLEKKH